MARGRHRKPTNTKRNVQRAVLVGAGATAPLAFTSAALADDVVVEPGDTLSEIAVEKLGLADWEAFYEENRAVIGNNPDLIFPGQTLHFAGGVFLPQPPVPVDVPAPVELPTEPIPVVVEETPPIEEPPPVEAVQQAAEEAGVDLPQAIIANSAGPVSARAQKAADRVWAHVPGASFITIGGTRSSARDMKGHPSGNALDYMVGGDSGLGDAIAQYHIDNWDSLGVDYLIWKQRIMMSPGGGWKWMEDRGSVTQNHYDHPHVNYRP